MMISVNYGEEDENNDDGYNHDDDSNGDVYNNDYNHCDDLNDEMMIVTTISMMCVTKWVVKEVAYRAASENVPEPADWPAPSSPLGKSSAGGPII